MPVLILLAPLALLGCPPSSRDSGAGAGSVDSANDTGYDPCPLAECAANVTWSTDGVMLAVTNVPGSLRFGMAQTGGSAGWYGEDCVDGPGPNSGDYDICHPASETGVTLDTVVEPGNVVAGSTTLFTYALAEDGSITYVLHGDAACWTWGHDPSYYESKFGCGPI